LNQPWVRPGSGEHDLVARLVTPGLHQAVHEHRVVVDIDPPQRKRQLPADQLQGREHHRTIARQDRQAFAPASGEIRGHQSPQKRALHAAAEVGHQIDFQPAGLFVGLPEKGQTSCAAMDLSSF
jgi:hypothetical protein